ncbi:MAG TPA: hypothetical protein VGE98_05270 [Thermoanaerobaculia bacterium]
MSEAEEQVSTSPDNAAVAAVLHQIRSGVRQRQAEIATLQGGEEVKLRLLELKTLEYLDEPIAFSPRPVTGKLLVFVRKAVFHLFLKWYLRPMRERQNRFNQVASQLIGELVANQARLAEALAKQARSAHGDETEGAAQSSGPEGR